MKKTWTTSARLKLTSAALAAEAATAATLTFQAPQGSVPWLVLGAVTGVATAAAVDAYSLVREKGDANE